MSAKDGVKRIISDICHANGLYFYVIGHIKGHRNQGQKRANGETENRNS